MVCALFPIARVVLSTVQSERYGLCIVFPTARVVLSTVQTSPQQGDLRLSGPPSGQGAASGARTRDRRVPADLRADSQATVLPTPPLEEEEQGEREEN
ncbi:hypothetical protein PoB_006195800 [Plakobranchus ocellatus]|uniref:Uncharacterized protein n=1 Tax=Plakobranchus ocellatus TaxID=259542 RepID=A0AAV4CUD4_9GAST|nr:hypothetical protein PoB_006195800 [Plakobranchus ocellatus]